MLIASITRVTAARLRSLSTRTDPEANFAGLRGYNLLLAPDALEV